MEEKMNVTQEHGVAIKPSKFQLKPRLSKDLMRYGLICVLFIACLIAFVTLLQMQKTRPLTTVQKSTLVFSIGSKTAVGVDPADVLSYLSVNDLIQGPAWKAWNDVQPSAGSRHICKIDYGVSNLTDAVVFRSVVEGDWQSGSQTVYDQFSVSSKFQINGVIAIDNWTDGTGASCVIIGNPQNGTFQVNLVTRKYRGYHYYILAIGHPVD